ncbi:type II toxin-antitoxin system RelE/ParE family toxin [Thiomicrospira sp. R3]|uniref:type II toxin-antitoxin system RelE family toxin n=1 Tax=Thiomicrospira sp. R3 TaxID=3035472 RepID=UPI00259B0182|nr:type II toxin-antitoxin system RelE/ParE family toxin [Thiomicrospira sp. R3]WFE68466.1 type II toxin-antitoxin system RelE/ParE family toxin [Thiomicrospira sp. R3]
MAKRILDYLDNSVAVRDNPRDYGRLLVGHLSGLWRYRVGNYRVICHIQEQELIILTTQISHRKDVYQ